MGHDSVRNFDVAMDLIDFYIKHYEKLGHRGTARKFKELREDIENAVAFGRSD